MSGQEIYNIVLGVVQGATILVVSIYTWQTWKLRKLSEEQTRIMREQNERDTLLSERFYEEMKQQNLLRNFDELVKLANDGGAYLIDLKKYSYFTQNNIVRFEGGGSKTVHLKELGEKIKELSLSKL